MEFEHVTQLQPDMNLQAFKDQIGNIEWQPYHPHVKG
jgi:hypothetical protein